MALMPVFLVEEKNEYAVRMRKKRVRIGACAPQNEMKASSLRREAVRSVIPRRVRAAARKAETPDGLLKERACG